jgi:hypothetical protein
LTKKIVVGLVDKVKVIGKKEIIAMAKFDTGAKRTSIDVEIAAKAKLGPIIKVTRVRSASARGSIRRPVVEAKIKVNGKTLKKEVNVEDRSHSDQKILIGRDIIFSNFIVDVEKTHTSPRVQDVRK